MQHQASAVGSIPFRELDGLEASQIFVHDLEQAIIDMLATDEFKRRAMDWFTKTGRFNSGACYPVVFMEGKVKIKVFASVESARSKEAMPPAFTLDMPVIQTGEMKPDTELVTEAEVSIQRSIGTSTENACDKARLEVGIKPLVPGRTPDGAVVNVEGKHEERAADYQQRFAKARETHVEKREAREAAAMNEAERERLAKENEARQIEPSSAPESGIK